MMKSIIRVGYMLGLVIVTHIAIMYLTPLNQSHLLAVLADKHKILAATPSPKIIFVGGSNLSFGLNSEEIRDALGINVVNMGLHAGLGLRYMLSEVQPYINAGDTVAVVPEYIHFNNGLNGSQPLREIIVFFPESLRYITSPEQVYTLLLFHPKSVREQVFWGLVGRKYYTCNMPYCREAFNAYGDAIGHLNLEPDTQAVLKQKIDCTTSMQTMMETIRVLNKFHAYARDKGASVFFSFPNIPTPGYVEAEECIQLLYARLEKNLDIPILGTPDRYAFPVEYFFDTKYHLTAAGIEVRTQYVIQDLQAALGENTNLSETPTGDQ